MTNLSRSSEKNVPLLTYLIYYWIKINFIQSTCLKVQDTSKHIYSIIWDSINKSLYFEVVLETKRGHSLYITNSRLLLEELWQVLSPFLMTPQTPRLMLFLTGYGLKRNRILYFGETLYSIAILIADQVFPIGLITKVSNMFPY